MNQPALIIAITVGTILLLILIVLLIKQNKPGSFGRKKTSHSSAMRRGMGSGIAIGMGTGVALGSAMDNIALGITIGAAIGTSLGVALGQSLQKKEEDNLHLQRNSKTETIHSYGSSRKRNISFMILLIGFLTLGIIMLFKLK